MSYILIKQANKFKHVKDLKLASNIWVYEDTKKSLLLMNQPLIDRIILPMINADLDLLIKQIITCLSEDDEDEGQISNLYDELAKQRSIILNKYEKYLSKRAQEVYMKKIRFAAFELKKRLITYNYPKTTIKRGK